MPLSSFPYNFSIETLLICRFLDSRVSICVLSLHCRPLLFHTICFFPLQHYSHPLLFLWLLVLVHQLLKLLSKMNYSWELLLLIVERYRCVVVELSGCVYMDLWLMVDCFVDS